MTTVMYGSRNRHDMAFASVFPPKDYTTPTPEATPDIGVIGSPGRSFGGFNASTTAEAEVRFNRAWSIATRVLSLSHGVSLGRETQDAFDLLLASKHSHDELIAWFHNANTIRYQQRVLPEVRDWIGRCTDAVQIVHGAVERLSRAQDQTFFNLLRLKSTMKDSGSSAHLHAFVEQAETKLHTFVRSSLGSRRLLTAIERTWFHQMSTALTAGESKTPPNCSHLLECRCAPLLDDALLTRMQDVGLGGEVGECAFAQAIVRLMYETVMEKPCFQVDWSGGSTVIPKLQEWTKKQLAPFVEPRLAVLKHTPSGPTFKPSSSDTKQYTDIAVANLGRQRAASLFDYVKVWPNSKGAILDIRMYLASGTASQKAQVCSGFIQQVQDRLLHAGATTTEILGIYVSVIHVFTSLDARRVLLEKVASPIRTYLRNRDDTVNIIASSFLAEIDGDGNVTHGDVDKVCGDLAVEVAKSTLDDGRDHKILNWDDMEWMPDPIDAGPDYKASRSEDILAYVLNLFDQEDFVSEVKNVLALHLLRADDPEYAKETRLVELMKARLDPTKLQAAEVMLKDVRDSVALNKRINPQAKHRLEKAPTPRDIQASIPEEGISLPSLYRVFEHRMKQAQFQAALNLVATRRNNLYYPKGARLPSEPAEPANTIDDTVADFKVQVLSSHFWPPMRSSVFQLPSQFVELADNFNARFNLLGSQRKLHWRSALIRMTVELELEDRQVKEVDVQAWAVSVINAFSSDTSAHVDAPPLQYNPDVGLTPAELAEHLQMEDDLVQDALNFWLSKRVLYRNTSESYTVLERLDMDIGDTALLVPGSAEEMDAVMSNDALFAENIPMFQAFITNMLKNGGSMVIGGPMGITSMLKMVLPTFTYGEEETLRILGGMHAIGMVVRDGEAWKVAG